MVDGAETHSTCEHTESSTRRKKKLEVTKDTGTKVILTRPAAVANPELQEDEELCGNKDRQFHHDLRYSNYMWLNTDTFKLFAVFSTSPRHM